MKLRETMGGRGFAAAALLGAAGLVASALPLFADASSAGQHHRMWPPETLTGTISEIVPSQKLVIVKGPDGVPFDMTVTHSTGIMANGQKANLNALNSDIGKNATVRFVPEGAGDIARTIQIGH